jgi:hypothetical protein
MLGFDGIASCCETLKSGVSTRCEVGVYDVRFITKGLCEWK